MKRRLNLEREDEKELIALKKPFLLRLEFI